MSKTKAKALNEWIKYYGGDELSVGGFEEWWTMREGRQK